MELELKTMGALGASSILPRVKAPCAGEGVHERRGARGLSVLVRRSVGLRRRAAWYVTFLSTTRCVSPEDFRTDLASSKRRMKEAEAACNRDGSGLRQTGLAKRRFSVQQLCLIPELTESGNSGRSVV